MALDRTTARSGGPVERDLWVSEHATGYTPVSTDGARPSKLALSDDLRAYRRITLLGRSSPTDLIVLYMDVADIPTCQAGDNIQTVGRSVNASGSAPGDSRSVPIACSDDGRTLHIVRGASAPMRRINRIVGRI